MDLKNDLFRAAQTNDVTLFERCIADGIDPLTTGERGESILHYISMTNSYGLLCHLTMYHSHVITSLVNQADKDRDTPLHWCCFRILPSLGVCDKLLTLGADPRLQDQWGQTCLELATVRSRVDLVTYLRWRDTHQQGLPRDIQGLDNISILQYINTFGSMHSGHALQYERAMKGRKEKSSNLRIIILGYQGVGKTTLCYRLTGQKRQVCSTDTLDILLNRLIIDRVTMARKLLDEGMELETSLQRIKDVVFGSMTTDDITNIVNGKSDDLRRPMSAYSGQLKPPPTLKRAISEPQALSELHAEAAVLMSKRPVESFGSCGQKTFVSVFDFGGESMFSNLQHVFLNSNAVILLVFSLHNCFDEKAVLERVYFWLKFIASYSCHVTDFYRPPIILVGTHLDRISSENKQQMVINQVNLVLSNNPEIAEIYEKHVFKFLTVDNTLEPEDCDYYDVIWRCVVEAAQYQSNWGQLLPGSWIALERELMRLKVQKKVVSFEEVRIIGEKLTVPLDGEEVKAMLEYLHMLRSILCFNMDLPNAKMILDPQWMVQAFRKIATGDKFFDQVHGRNHPLMKTYKENGKLTPELIDFLWKSDPDFLTFKDTLLYYLERLELLVKPLPGEGESSVDIYIVPCMLQLADVDLIKPMLDRPETTMSATLCYDFQGRFIPPAVFNKILASCIHRFQVLIKPNGLLCLQQGLACFVLNPRWNVVLHCKDSLMKVTLFTQSADDTGVCNTEAAPGEGFGVRKILDDIVKATLERNEQQHMEYRYYFHHRYDICPGQRLYDVMDVKETPVVQSSGSYDDVDSMLPPLNRLDYEVWFTSPQETPRKERRDSKSLNRCPTPREMSRIAKYIGTCYSIFFAVLGLHDNVIDHIRLQYGHFHFRSQVTKMLIVWRNTMKTRATLLEIVKAMEFNDLFVEGMMEEIGSASFLSQKAADMVHPEDIDLPYQVQRSCPCDLDTWTFAECIGNMYYNAMIELGLKNQCIERAEMDHRNRVLHVIHALLQEWVNGQRSEATVLKLYLTLAECQGDCLDFVDGINQNRQQEDVADDEGAKT